MIFYVKDTHRHSLGHTKRAFSLRLTCKLPVPTEKAFDSRIATERLCTSVGCCCCCCCDVYYTQQKYIEHVWVPGKSFPKSVACICFVCKCLHECIEVLYMLLYVCFWCCQFGFDVGKGWLSRGASLCMMKRVCVVWFVWKVVLENKLLSIFIGRCSSVGLSISSEHILHICRQCKRGKYRIFFLYNRWRPMYVQMKTSFQLNVNIIGWQQPIYSPKI